MDHQLLQREFLRNHHESRRHFGRKLRNGPQPGSQRNRQTGAPAPRGGEIQEALVEEHTGISKDFNSFELLSALIRKDHLKANRIVNYFEANPQKQSVGHDLTPFFVIFLNLLTYHYQKKSTPNIQEMARLLGVHPFFMKDYTDGSRVYNAVKCANIISLLREYDMKAKRSR